MLVIGAKGFAKEILDVLHQLNELDQLAFYDDINENAPQKLFNTFPILKTVEQARDYFNTTDNRFAIGVGNPILRKGLFDKFEALGGKVCTTISTQSNIGQYGVKIGDGTNVLDQAVLSSDITVGRCAIIYYSSIVTHDVQIGDFVEISPGAILLGRCKVGDYSQIGSHATVLPDVTIGKNVIVGAGAVVTRDVPDNCIVVGVPAIVKKRLEPLSL